MAAPPEIFGNTADTDTAAVKLRPITVPSDEEAPQVEENTPPPIFESGPPTLFDGQEAQSPPSGEGWYVGPQGKDIDIDAWEKWKNISEEHNFEPFLKRQEFLQLPPKEQQAYILATSEKGYGGLIRRGKMMEIPGRFGYGYIKGRSFGAPELFAKALGKDIPEPTTEAAAISEEIGSLFGLHGALRWMTTLGPFRYLHNLKPTSKIGVLGKRMGIGGLKLGAYSVLSEWGGKNIQEIIQKKMEAGTSGGGLGAYFGLVSAVATSSKNPYVQFGALAMRLGLNELVTGGPAYNQWKEGAMSTPRFVYNVGLGVLFSLSGDPVGTEAKFNGIIKEKYRIKNLTREALETEIQKAGRFDKLNDDIKWAYIMKTTDGKVTPTSKNAGAVDYIFGEILANRNKPLFDKLTFVSDIQKDIEAQFPGVKAAADAPKMDIPNDVLVIPTKDGATTFTITSPEYKQQEAELKMEMATGQDVGLLKRTARARGMSDSQINQFLRAYSEGDITLSKLKGKVSKERIEELRGFMKLLTTDQSGRARISAKTDILPMDFFEWAKEKGSIFDWMQTARMPIRKIYDLVKPAYENYMTARRTQMDKLNKIYGKRVRRGSKEDVLLAKYADNRINFEDLPKNLQDIATQRKAFYDRYADILIEKGLVAPEKVFNKDGTRKPYYHRIFDGVLEETAFKAGFSLDDIYLPGNMPTPGALKKRTGAWGTKYSAIESDMRYVYGIEKYLNMAKEVDAATAYAKQLTGMRKNMANVYIRAMRGQPAHFDKMIKEQLTTAVNKTGDMMELMKLPGAKGFQKWVAPSYPISRIASPLARFYYWRYVGLAMDTSFKNSIQWHHAVARYGPDNTAKAMRMQFTKEGKDLIKESGIHRESIQRGGHFIEEAGTSNKLSNIEEASYFMWTAFDTNNRNVSGLAGYLHAKKQGLDHGQRIKAMREASHETQYGYTKADSLLMDLANPMSRFILFKKWPLAKVEMVRSWLKGGNTDAVFNLALQEYMIYRAAQSVGVDLGAYFNSIWQLATRGIESPIQMVPVASEILGIYQMFGKGTEAKKAKEKTIRAWQGLSNRWLGKVVDYWKAWQDDWNVRDIEGGLKYKSTFKEETIKLFAKPVETTKRFQQTKRMLNIAETIKDAKHKIILELLHGNPDKAAKMQQELLNRYGEEYAQEFGKKLEPVNLDDIKNLAIKQQTPTEESIRARMPGTGLLKVPPGLTFEGKKPRGGIIEKVRGY